MPSNQDFRDSFSGSWEQWLEQQPEFHEDIAIPTSDPMIGRGAPLGEFPPSLESETPYGHLVNFLFGGEWLYVTSSWLRAIQYDDKNEDLTIEYLSGAVCQYHGVSVDMAADLAGAPSKGRWVHANLIPWDYVLISVGSSEVARPNMTRKGPGMEFTKVDGPRRVGRSFPRPPRGRAGRRRTYDPGQGTRKF